MSRIILVLPLALGACLAAAQDHPQPPSASEQDKIPVHNLPIDPAKLAVAVRDSYYHPDTLSGLECSVSLDWSGIMHAMKVEDPPPERMKIVEGLKVRTRATRDKATEITFNWSGGELPDGKDRIEGGIRQMVSGFYQMYWPMIASSSVPAGIAFEKVEPLNDGNMKVYLRQAQSTTEITIDKDHIPTHYSVENPTMKGTLDPHYTPSPNPVPGDLRRITELDVSNQIGVSRMSVEVILDYQPVDVFYVPQHVTFNLVGAFSIGMDFSGCSASKRAAGSEIKN